MVEKIQFVEAYEVGDAHDDGTYPVVLLTPGLGATAYYSEEVVRDYAPTAFPKGTHVYADHWEGEKGPSVEKLLGTLVDDTTIRESDGAAINRLKPLEGRAQLVKDIHKHVGLSINASGDARLGTMDGRQVKIAESIDYNRWNSVDVVSYPGREGSGFVFAESLIVEAFKESVHPDRAGDNKNGNKMELEEKVDKLTESLTSLVTLVESLVPKAPETDADKDRLAAVEAVRIVEAAEVPKSVKDSLVEGIKAGNYNVNDRISEVVSLREELKTEFQESLNAGAAGKGGAGAEPVKVAGWSTL